jgi:thiamine-monophosphate kinase
MAESGICRGRPGPFAIVEYAVPIAEKKLIERIRRLAAASVKPGLKPSRTVRAHGVITGIGDDCAVLRPVAGQGRKQDTLVTTDFSLEGIHFRRDWHTAESVGHRCLARGLSDIAAMGGEPVAAFLSLALPHNLPQSWVTGFLRGLTRLAEKFGVVLAGGDTAESPDGILADIIVIGSVPEGEAVLRSGARAGDRIYVSGQLGGSAAAISELRRKPKRKLSPEGHRRHFFPEPRIELGRTLRKRGLASAMIDISDGLSTDLAHICQESGVGAEIEAEAIPRASVGSPRHEVELEFALHGGEDYELLFTAPRGRRIPSQIGGVPLARIGRITRGRKVVLRNREGGDLELQARGWEHFKS